MSVTESSFWILTALATGPRHGYAILRDVAELSGGDALRVTTLYAALERLDRAGSIEVSGEEIVDGRARRYYRLTPAGTSSLEHETARLEARARAARARLTPSRPATTPGIALTRWARA